MDGTCANCSVMKIYIYTYIYNITYVYIYTYILYIYIVIEYNSSDIGWNFATSRMIWIRFNGDIIRYKTNYNYFCLSGNGIYPHFNHYFFWGKPSHWWVEKPWDESGGAPHIRQTEWGFKNFDHGKMARLPSSRRPQVCLPQKSGGFPESWGISPVAGWFRMDKSKQMDDQWHFKYWTVST